MFFKYLIVSVENNKKRYFPAHPLAERVFQIDGEFIPAGTESETEYDKVPVVVDPSITDKIKVGVDLRPMGSVPPQTGLAASEFAESFVARFNAAGLFGSKPADSAPADSAPADSVSADFVPADSSK